jgi:hypothetical protein
VHFSLQRRYSPGWASASFKSFLHPSRFRATTFQFLHPSLNSFLLQRLLFHVSPSRRPYYVHLVGIKRSDCLYKLVRIGSVLSKIQIRHHQNRRVPSIESNCLVSHVSSLNSEALIYATWYVLNSMCWCAHAPN